MNEKTAVLIGTLGTIILGVFASLIAWFAGKDALQGRDREIVRQMFNLELTLMIVGIIASFIPFLGILICLVLVIIAIVYAIMAYVASNNDKEFKISIAWDFVK